MAEVELTIVELFGYILVGVVVSIVFPIVIKWVTFPATQQSLGFMQYVNSVYMPYVKAAIAAVVISLLILIFLPENIDNAKSAVLLGFGWEAFIKNLQP